MAHVIRSDIDFWTLLVLVAVFAILLLWMLGRFQRWKGLLQSLNRIDIVATSSTHQSASNPALLAAGQKHHRTMFHKAAAKFEADAAKQKTLSQTSLPSSSPTQTHLDSRRQRGGSMHLGNSILRPSPPSAMNVPFKRQVPTAPLNGIKRTISGLQKASTIHGSFEASIGRGSQAEPILIEENESATKLPPVATSNEFFNEDDFDSDIDLDVEDPTLMNQLRSSGMKKPTARPTTTFQPTAPRQQHLSSYHDPIDLEDSGYDSFSKKHQKPPQSSSAIPWSSSPPEHTRTATPSKHFQQFVFTGDTKPAQPASKIEHKPVAQPPKKRTLPWKAAEEQQAQMVQNGPPPPNGGAFAAAAQASRTPKTKTPSLWNTTASAVKEQQRLFREVNKKKSVYDEAADQAMSMVEAERKAKEKIAKVFLSPEQQHVLDLVVTQNKSVFFTGSAGTGKSVLLREIIAALRKKHQKEQDRVAVTASTGLAACNIGGVTLHSFAGIGLGKGSVDELVRNVRRNQKSKQRWLRTKILIIDEVSMVDGELFDKLEAVARQIKNNGRPFGGIQLIITGDFFQLPPVPDKSRGARFAFDASAWRTVISHVIGLHQVFRQKDPVFAGMLNEMREGRLSKSSIEAFQRLSRPLESNTIAATMATELFPTRTEVEKANSARMNQLVGDVQTYEARDGGSAEADARKRLLANCMAPETIALKKGAQVMLIKNIDESLVNGSIGKVLGFMSEMTFDRYENHEEEYLNTQKDAIKDAAASESSLDPAAARKAKATSRIMDNMMGSTTQLYPVVRFTLANATTRDLLCQRESWKIELPNGEVQAMRSQVPLILAWALSIHKAQGQTLEKVKVDLGKVFEKGQAYVALSRATSMAGLQVLNFDPNRVMAHDKVRSFYANLSRVEDLEQGASKKRKSAKDDYERNFVTGR